jgi:hypothetical protein
MSAMKTQWVWLLAVLYVASFLGESKDYKGKRHPEYEWTVLNSSNGMRAVWDCFGKEACEDTADALNEAHERRTCVKKGIDEVPVLQPSDVQTYSFPFCKDVYKKPCIESN